MSGRPGQGHGFFFSPAHLFLLVKAVPVQRNSKARKPSREAAGNGGRDGEVREDLAQERGVPINVGSATERERQKTGGESPRSCEGDEGRPTQREGRGGCGPAGGRDGPRPAASKQADEVSGLTAPAPSNFKRNDGEPAAVGTAELWVGALLGPPGCLEGCTSSLAPDPARGTSSGEGRDQGGVNRDLGTPPQRQTVGDHLNAPVILTDGVEIEISDEDVEGNRRPCFSADPGGRSLQRGGTVCGQLLHNLQEFRLTKGKTKRLAVAYI